MTDITLTDTPHGLHLDTDGGTPVTISPDAVAAIVQHELGKLGLWWAEDQRALIQTRPDGEGDYVVLFLDDLASGAHWATVGVEAMTPTSRRLSDTLDAYLASLPAKPKPGEVWELNPGDESFTADVIELPGGAVCFVWYPFDEVAIGRVDGFFEGNRRKIADAPDDPLDKVRAALANHPRCDRHDDDPVTCGWKSAVLDVQAALDGAES